MMPSLSLLLQRFQILECILETNTIKIKGKSLNQLSSLDHTSGNN